MAKQSGLGDNFYWDGYDLSGDVGSLQNIRGGPKPLGVTGINASAQERIGGARDGGIDFQSWFNPAALQQHAALKGLPTTDVLATYCRGTTLGNPAACLISKQANYDGTRGNDGSFSFSIQALANGYGLEWGNQLTAGKKTDTSGANGTGVDFAASTSLGWQAYLQVFSITGTSVTITLEDSADNVSFATFTGSAFAAAAARGTQRLQGGASATVRRYVRAVSSGTFTEAIFNVVFVKNSLTGVTF